MVRSPSPNTVKPQQLVKLKRSITVTQVSLEHKTSHEGQFDEIEIYASINHISIDVWFGQYLKICLNIEKIIFKVVQIKFLAMHINNQ